MADRKFSIPAPFWDEGPQDEAHDTAWDLIWKGAQYLALIAAAFAALAFAIGIAAYRTAT